MINIQPLDKASSQKFNQIGEILVVNLNIFEGEITG